jgi:hypothetical protein
MRDVKWREQLRSLVNSFGVDTELDAPDHVIAYHIDSFLNSIRQFSCHEGYTPLNNAVCTILQHPTAKGTQCRKNKKRVTAPF